MTYTMAHDTTQGIEGVQGVGQGSFRLFLVRGEPLFQGVAFP